MATEISLDLINQLNLSLRKNAKLSSLDSSSLSLPTAPEAIAELDPSPPYLRCRNCKGKLLRGIESLICVFCGEQQRTSDNAPDPIKLTSTSAYKWFLTSLDLDGSEMVEAIKETSGSSRGGKVPVVKGVALSEFLDLEVQWCAREEMSDGVSVQKKSPLNMGGISLDDYFVEEREELSKVDTAESKAVEDDDFKDPRSLSLFDSVKSQGVVESQQSENVGLVKGNDAKKNESLSLFAGRDGQDSVSLAEQGNFGFFEGKDSEHSFKEDENLSLFDGKAAPGTSSSIKDDSFGFFGSSDAQRTSSSKEDESFGFFEGKDAQRNSASKEDGNLGLFEGKDDQRNSSSKEDESFGLFEGAPSSDDKVVASSSDWDSDFQSVSQEKISSDPFVSSPADLSAHMDSVFGSGKQADSSTAYVSKAGDWLQDDLFGNVTGKSQNNDKNEGQVLGGNGSSSMDIDWIGDDLWQTSEKKAIEKTPTNDDDDDWNDFASSANSKTPSNLLSRTMERSQEDIFDGMSHVKEQSEYEKQNTATSMISDIAKGQEDDDLFGTWDSFASSTVLQTPVQPPTNHVNQSAEQNQGMNLFGESNQQSDLDSGLFSESIGGQTYSEEVKAMPSGTLTSERTGDPDGQDQVTTVSRKSKSDVAEELMSQMHDLSFMLETKLSVPPISKAE
ncbi:hypothetical protein HID58_031249 [Brassica napus]|uniref:DUF7815 domain-containing protein n=2 Tax=Brassica TaxID=3705 RepID=A0ABQ8CID7_BRANA|nr:WASH complex subunit 2-like [Brassica napus]KAH0916803.1 hypothetical protein HID58_031249 [Brassica napus]CAG7900235.1 unnamed protein product [Brassica rapa]VDD08455.1 unnamed protein product [Brassica rapa]